MATFTDSIRFAQTDQLVRLLQLRPDLASPSPGTLFSLGARASNTHSMSKAMAQLNSVALQVLESVVVLSTMVERLTLTTVATAILGPDPEPGTDGDDYLHEVKTIADSLNHLCELALVWQPDAETYRGAPGLEEILDRFPAGFGPRAQQLPELPVTGSAPAAAHSILSAMQWGPPVGIVPSNLMEQQDTHHESATPSALRWLLKNNYLELIDPTHVSLPREVAYALRGNRTHKGLLKAPDLNFSAPAISEPQIQMEGAAASAELVRRIAELISVWESEPAPALRAGGLPVREVRNVGNRLDLTVPQVHMVAELAFAARLIRASDGNPQVFAPTSGVDGWLEQDLVTRWQHLVLAWLNSPRTSWHIGQLDDRAQTISALSPGAHQSHVVRLRATILKVLAEHPAQALRAQDVATYLEWQTPRSEPNLEAISGILAEAAALGVTGAGALLPGLLTRSEDKPGWTFDPVGALTNALPEPVQEIFIQGDLTAMVPGRPCDPLETLLSECTQVESRGGALTVRFTTASLTRAFDTGRTAQGLMDELQMYCVTPIPQPLAYLIKDVARNHGRVRVGAVSTYIRISDPVVMASILSSPAFAAVGVLALGSDVLGATGELPQVLALLREAKLSPAVEDPSGNIITADRLTPQTRLPAALSKPEFWGGLPSNPVSAATIFANSRIQPQADVATLVAHLITATESDLPVASSADGLVTEPAGEVEAPGPTGATITFLREAITEGAEVWLDLVDSAGRVTRRKLKPMSIDSGRLRAADLDRESELTVSVHRIANAQPVEMKN